MAYYVCPLKIFLQVRTRCVRMQNPRSVSVIVSPGLTRCVRMQTPERVSVSAFHQETLYIILFVCPSHPLSV